MRSYRPFESSGLNIVELIRELGEIPFADSQAPIEHNIAKALWSLKSAVDINSALPAKTAIIASDSPYLASDGELIFADTTDGDITINLPISTVSGIGVVKTVEPNNIIVTAPSGQNIKGDPTLTIQFAYSSASLFENNGDYYLL